MLIIQIILRYALTIFLVALVGRMIVSWIQAFAHSWQPTGVILILAETIFTVTDPPLKFLRRFIPSFRLGTVSLDLSFMVLYFVVLILLIEVVPLI
ncbi:MAG: YggT family protein [Streptosporangiales bacterium]|nr:YggT family protein [Streptosporangiales bacterium]